LQNAVREKPAIILEELTLLEVRLWLVLEYFRNGNFGIGWGNFPVSGQEFPVALLISQNSTFCVRHVTTRHAPVHSHFAEVRDECGVPPAVPAPLHVSWSCLDSAAYFAKALLTMWLERAAACLLCSLSGVWLAELGAAAERSMRPGHVTMSL